MYSEPVVGMKPLNYKGKRGQDLLQYRKQKALTDVFDREHALELSDLVDGVDDDRPL